MITAAHTKAFSSECQNKSMEETSSYRSPFTMINYISILVRGNCTCRFIHNNANSLSQCLFSVMLSCVVTVYGFAVETQYFIIKTITSSYKAQLIIS